MLTQVLDLLFVVVSFFCKASPALGHRKHVLVGVFIRVLRFALPKWPYVEDFSHKSSMFFSPKLFSCSFVLTQVLDLLFVVVSFFL